MELLGRLAILLGLLVLGTALRRSGVLDPKRTGWLNALAYYVALPALIFTATYDQSVGELVSPALLVGLPLVLLAVAGLAALVYRRQTDAGRRSVAIVQSYHSNLGYMGLPLVAATFDAAVTAVASVVFGIVALLQTPATILLLVRANDAAVDVGQQLRRLARNPVLLSLGLGLVVGSVGLALPAPAVGALDGLGRLALPLALLCVGASLQIDAPTLDLSSSVGVVLLKNAAMPVLAWTVFAALAVDGPTFVASVVMLSTPSAVSTYVYARELGGDWEFASLNVFLTTVTSVATLFVVITLVQ